jgi:hypothetical protein
MSGLHRIFSRRCCGGPVLVLALAFMLIGALFTLLSAPGPGLVFGLVGIGSLGLCVMLGQSRCSRGPSPLGSGISG